MFNTYPGHVAAAPFAAPVVDLTDLNNEVLDRQSSEGASVQLDDINLGVGLTYQDEDADASERSSSADVCADVFAAIDERAVVDNTVAQNFEQEVMGDQIPSTADLNEDEAEEPRHRHIFKSPREYF